MDEFTKHAQKIYAAIDADYRRQEWANIQQRVERDGNKLPVKVRSNEIER